MSETKAQVAVLLADITGSTPLYESVGDAEAARRVGACVDWMRETVEAAGGAFIKAQGDDILATFVDPDAALTAVEQILARMPMGGLSVHAGLHFGWIVATRGDIFGDAVNLTARLAALANPGEVLISSDLATRLPNRRAATLRPLNAMALKGKSASVEVYSLAEDTQLSVDPLARPEALAADMAGRAATLLSVMLAYEGRAHIVSDGESASLGRAPDNDIVLAKPWISRKHATIAVAGGRVQFTDRSSYGSYVADFAGYELIVRRETVVMSGTGTISPGASAGASDAVIISYKISTPDRPA